MSINGIYAKMNNIENTIEETNKSNMRMFDKLEKSLVVLSNKHSSSNSETETSLLTEYNLEPITKQFSALENSVDVLSTKIDWFNLSVSPNIIANINNKLSELDNSVSELSTNVSTFSILPSVVNKINDIEQVLSDLISKKYVVDNTSKEVNTLTDKIEALEKRVEELSFTISKMD
jgi:hypothetical protein